MTERLYYNDSNLLDFEAKVAESGKYQDGFYTVLDRSAFYPTSGGQSHDTGTLNSVPINDVIESDSGDVWHLSATEPGAVGQRVVGLIDKERRYRNCRNHTGQHILSAAAARLFDMETMSVHLGDEYAAVELDAKSLSDDQLTQIEALANEVIADNVEIEIIFADSQRVAALPLRKKPKREGKLRIIRIGQFDYVACGGTHCTTSGGVGLLKITGTEKIRERVLVKYLAGKLAVADYIQRFNVTDRLARALTCHPTDLVARVEKLTADNKELRRELTDIRKELLPGQAMTLAAKAVSVHDTHVVVEEVTGLDPSAAGRLAILVADEINGLAALLAGGRLVLATAESSNLHAGNMAREIAARCNLKGGGNSRTAQLGGSVSDQFDSCRKVIHSLLQNE